MRPPRHPNCPAGTAAPTRCPDADASRRCRTLGAPRARHGAQILHRTPAGRCTDLIRGQPGARLPEHDHDDDEEIYVLAGDLTIGTLALRVGDYHVARRGYHHPVVISQNGCLLLVTSRAT